LINRQDAKNAQMIKFVSFIGLPNRLAALVLSFAAVVGWCSVVSASDHGGHGGSGHGGHSGDAASASGSAAIELGDYRIRSYYPVQAQKSVVRFLLYATAPPEHLAGAQQAAAQRRHKIRDQVITATRMMPLSEFDDPDLVRLRRRILLRLRRALPELKIENLYISNFELQVQSL
jgi:hypothetical protein